MKNIKDFYCEYVLNNKIPIKKAKETDNVLAFFHTKPSWTFHVVIIPKDHISGLEDVQNFETVSEIFSVAKEIVIENKLQDSNYKIITNGGSFQDSKHLHFHLVSGEKLK